MLQITVNNKHNFSVDNTEGKTTVNGVSSDSDIIVQPNNIVSILHNGKSYTGTIEKIDEESKEVSVKINGQLHTTTIKEPIDLLLSNMGLGLANSKKIEPIKAPMPGMVIKFLVSPGQEINKGDGLVILEAMKMENVLKAAAPGKVKAIKVAERTAVEKGTVLIELDNI